MVEPKFKIGDKVTFFMENLCCTVTCVYPKTIRTKNEKGENVELISFSYDVQYEDDAKTVCVNEELLKVCN